MHLFNPVIGLTTETSLRLRARRRVSSLEPGRPSGLVRHYGVVSVGLSLSFSIPRRHLKKGESPGGLGPQKSTAEWSLRTYKIFGISSTILSRLSV